jgi:hypothetical protein
MDQTQRFRYLMFSSSVGRQCRQCFLLDKSCRKMYTIFSAVLCQQEKWRHDIFLALRPQRRLLSNSFPLLGLHYLNWSYFSIALHLWTHTSLGSSRRSNTTAGNNQIWHVEWYWFILIWPLRTYSPFLVLSHMYVEQKLLGRSRKSLVFLKSNFFGSEKFQVSAHVLPK